MPHKPGHISDADIPFRNKDIKAIINGGKVTTSPITTVKVKSKHAGAFKKQNPDATKTSTTLQRNAAGKPKRSLLTRFSSGKGFKTETTYEVPNQPLWSRPSYGKTEGKEGSYRSNPKVKPSWQTKAARKANR